MPTIDTLRPNATDANSSPGWAAVGAASLHAALSDDSDTSYGSNSSGLAVAQLSGATLSPAVDHEFHQQRVQVRLADVPGVSGPITTIGTFAGGQSSIAIEPSLTPTNYVGPWAFTAQATGARTPIWQLQRTTGSGEERVYEVYLFVDSRNKPTFVADVYDAAGVSRDAGIISDTNRPNIAFETVDYDALAARSWTLTVTDDATMTVVYSAGGNGQPPASVLTDPLPDGNYTADLQIFSTIRANDAFASDVEQVTFEMAFVPPDAPDLTATPTANPPSVELCWDSPASPGPTAWDDPDDIVIEIRRTDCNGTSTIYVAQEPDGCHVDRFMSLSEDGVFCGEADHDCQICYEARFWGLVNDALVTSDWTEECLTLDNPTPGEDWIHGATSGDLAICPDRSYSRTRPFGRFQPIGGGIPTVVTGVPGGRDYSLAFPVTSEADLVSVEAILAQPLVFYQPSHQADLWLAPDQETVRVVKVGRIRDVSVTFVAVEPQPLTDPASFFA